MAASSGAQYSAQLGHMRDALKRLNVPVHVIHGDADDFAPIEFAEALVKDAPTRRPMSFIRVPGANHFMNDGPVELLLNALERCIPAKAPAFEWKLPALDFGWLKPKPHAGQVA
jgi:pimeloyl-ACP methyl ester carboxylesterase